MPEVIDRYFSWGELCPKCLCDPVENPTLRDVEWRQETHKVDQTVHTPERMKVSCRRCGFFWFRLPHDSPRPVYTKQDWREMEDTVSLSGSTY